MRLKRRQRFYKLPNGVVEVRGVKVKIGGCWHYLQGRAAAENLPNHTGKPEYWRFYQGHLEIAPAPNKAYFAEADVLYRMPF